MTHTSFELAAFLVNAKVNEYVARCARMNITGTKRQHIAPQRLALDYYDVISWFTPPIKSALFLLVFLSAVRQSLKILPIQLLPALRRGVLHRAENFFLDFGGQVRGGVLA